MKKVVTIGGATQDIFILYDNAETMYLHSNAGSKSYLLLEQGSKINVTRVHYATGGGATNTAVSLKQLGLSVTSCFKIGSDQAGEFIKSYMQKFDIQLKISLSPNKDTATSFIIPSLNKDYAALTYRGASSFFDFEQVPLQILDKADYVYITSLTGQSAHLLPEIAKYTQKSNGIIAHNPGISQLKNIPELLYESLKYTDIFILNAREACTFFTVPELEEKFFSSKRNKKAIKNNNENNIPELFKLFCTHNRQTLTIRDYFHAILQAGSKIAIVTNGSEGVYVATKEALYFQPSILTQIVSTVGAGDAFGSTFVGCLALGKSIETAILYGTINSSSVLNYLDAKTGLLKLEELEQRALQVQSNLIKLDW